MFMVGRYRPNNNTNNNDVKIHVCKMIHLLEKILFQLVLTLLWVQRRTEARFDSKQ